MKKGITLSPKHGLNPSMGVCFYCGEQDGTVVLPGRLTGDAEAPRSAVWSKEPCPKCAAWMQAGVILLSVRDGEEGPNPYRTGRLAVVKDEAIRRIVTRSELADDLIKKRVGFVPDSAWAMLGLPA